MVTFPQWGLTVSSSSEILLIFEFRNLPVYTKRVQLTRLEREKYVSKDGQISSPILNKRSWFAGFEKLVLLCPKNGHRFFKGDQNQRQYTAPSL